MTGEYLGQDVLLGTVVPSRVAYVIDQGGQDSFRRAVQLASMRWGGECEPIVELGTAGLSDADCQLISTASVEAAV